MPKVRMPDGTLVDMPDNPSPELKARLEKFLAGQSQQAQFSPMNLPTIEDTAGQVTAPEPTMRDPRTDPSATGTLLKGAGNFVMDAVKDIGYSLTGGHTREAIRGDSPEPGPLSIRSLNPFLSAARKYGGETGKRASDVTAGVIHDVGNVAPLVKPAANLLRAGLRSLPGAAPILQEEAIAAARKIPGDAIKGPASQPFWNAVKAEGGMGVRADKIADTIDEAVVELSKASNPDTNAISFLTNIRDGIKSRGGFNTIETIDADRRMIANLNLGHLEEKIYGAYHAALDDAAKGGVGVAGNLKAAINASKKEFARDELSKLIEKKIHTRAADKIESINTAAIQDALRKTEKGKKIIERLGAGEIAQIESTLRAINPPALPPPGGANWGSGKFWQKQGILGGISSLLGLATGDPKIAATAMAAGNVALGAEYYLSRLLVTKPGRDFLRKLSTTNLSGNPAAAPALLEAMNKLIMGDDKKGQGTEK